MENILTIECYMNILTEYVFGNNLDECTSIVDETRKVPNSIISDDFLILPANFLYSASLRAIIMNVL